jgi:hypothetical protein
LVQAKGAVAATPADKASDGEPGALFPRILDVVSCFGFGIPAGAKVFFATLRNVFPQRHGVPAGNEYRTYGIVLTCRAVRVMCPPLLRLPACGQGMCDRKQTMTICEDFQNIADRLRQIEHEKRGRLGVPEPAPANSAAVSEATPQDFDEWFDSLIWSTCC